MVPADDGNILGGSLHCKENTETLVVVFKEAGLEVSAEEIKLFLISNFRHVLNLNVCILLGISPASD